jgi:hypothetical protein
VVIQCTPTHGLCQCVDALVRPNGTSADAHSKKSTRRPQNLHCVSHPGQRNNLLCLYTGVQETCTQGVTSSEGAIILEAAQQILLTVSLIYQVLLSSDLIGYTLRSCKSKHHLYIASSSGNKNLHQEIIS